MYVRLTEIRDPNSNKVGFSKMLRLIILAALSFFLTPRSLSGGLYFNPACKTNQAVLNEEVRL